MNIMKQMKMVSCLLNQIHSTRGITPKHAMRGRVHLRVLAPGQHSSEETTQRWRAVGDTVPDLAGPGIVSLANVFDLLFSLDLEMQQRV